MLKKDVIVGNLNIIKRGNLVNNLKINDSRITNKQYYKLPKVKKLTYKKNNTRIVMGCWQENYTINNGDGC